jgi:hypothetical protein
MRQEVRLVLRVLGGYRDRARTVRRGGDVRGMMSTLSR